MKPKVVQRLTGRIFFFIETKKVGIITRELMLIYSNALIPINPLFYVYQVSTSPNLEKVNSTFVSISDTVDPTV